MGDFIKRTVYVPPDAAYGRGIQAVANPSLEYVSSQPNPLIGKYVQSLPAYIDDVTRDFGHDLYEKMMVDAQVFSCVQIFKLTIMAEGWSLAPAVSDQNAPDYQRSKEIADFCTDALKALDVPFEQFLFEMYDATYLGHKVAEKVTRVEREGKHRGKTVYARLKVKPNQCYSFVVDAFNNVLGLMAIIPGRSYVLYQGTVLYGQETLPNIVPRAKFCVLTFNPKDGDPRGRSVLRAVYDPWWQKLQIKGEYLKYLTQFGTPIIWGTTAPDASPEAVPQQTTGGDTTDANGNLVTSGFRSPEQLMLESLLAMRSGSCAAFTYGSQIQALNVPAAGGVFMEALNWNDKQIAKGILGQTLATEEGEHQARAAAETHMDILDMVLSYARRAGEAMAKNDLLRDLVRWNYGEQEAHEYTPTVQFGSKDDPKWQQNVQAAASLASSKLLAASQVNWVHEKLRMPAANDPTPYEQEMKSSIAGPAPGQPPPGAPAQAPPGLGQPPGIPPSPEAGGPPQGGPPSEDEDIFSGVRSIDPRLAQLLGAA